ncbi:hypothetical protein C9J85_14665 [Haloferax sp. wsp5]|nr:hypothetical protein C9J85_14665 [Haloferax sp. wsp5]
MSYWPSCSQAMSVSNAARRGGGHRLKRVVGSGQTGRESSRRSTTRTTGRTRRPELAGARR